MQSSNGEPGLSPREAAKALVPLGVFVGYSTVWRAVSSSPQLATRVPDRTAPAGFRFVVNDLDALAAALRLSPAQRRAAGAQE